MTILLCDPRVAAVPVHETGEPLVRLATRFGPARAMVRAGLAARLDAAAKTLPGGLHLRVVEGHRTIESQRAILTRYAAQVRVAHPAADAAEVDRLTSRFVSPVAVAPHVAGAAVDLTLTDACGEGLDLGTAIDATPEQSDGRCFTAAENIDVDARAHRDLLAQALRGAGLVNYPTEWWHWSYGDRYWALVTGAPAAPYGPVSETTWFRARTDAA